MSFRLANEGDGLNDIIVRGLDLYTVAIPPALPIALTIGVVFAVDRLKKERIACVAPSRLLFVFIILYPISLLFIFHLYFFFSS